MFEGALFGVALLLIVVALIGVLNWLFEHGRAVVSTLIVAPVLLWIWWQEWFGNVLVFALMAVVLLGIVTWAQEGLIKRRDYRDGRARAHHGEP